nr:hypothetical protein AW07_01411 [Ipomoea batatas]
MRCSIHVKAFGLYVTYHIPRPKNKDERVAKGHVDAVNDDIGAQFGRRQDHRREGVVDDDRGSLVVGNPGELRDVSDGEGWIGDAFEVEDLGFSLNDGVFHGGEVPDVDERGGDIADPREEMGEQGVGAAVEGTRRHHVIAGAEELEQHRRDRRHAGGGAVGRLGAFHGGHEAANVEHRRVEVTAVDEVIVVRSQLPGEHPPQRLRLHHRERGGGLDGHIDAAVLAELVAGAGQRRRRVIPHLHARLAALLGLHHFVALPFLGTRPSFVGNVVDVLMDGLRHYCCKENSKKLEIEIGFVGDDEIESVYI